jgi:hypothetical protein
MGHRRRRTFLPYKPACFLLLALFLVGCVSSPSSAPSPRRLLREQASFPPQVAMENGDYAGFVAENQRLLERCKARGGCAVALFNLGFVYGYPQSPYYNPAKAQQYFEALRTQYPQTPWAFQGQAWTAFINEKLAWEERQRRLQATIRQEKHALEETRRRLQADLRTREADLRTREETIRSLQERLKRFRDIDLEMDKKEQEFLR